MFLCGNLCLTAEFPYLHFFQTHTLGHASYGIVDNEEWVLNESDCDCMCIGDFLCPLLWDCASKVDVLWMFVSKGCHQLCFHLLVVFFLHFFTLCTMLSALHKISDFVSVVECSVEGDMPGSVAKWPCEMN